VSPAQDSAGHPAVAAEPLGFDSLLKYFEEAEKPFEKWRIGTEHEKIGLLCGERARVPYEGPGGIGALLDRIAGLAGWEPIQEEGRTIALAKAGASITLEPGGQLELSGAPLHHLKETCSEFNGHVDLLKETSEQVGIDWLSLGADPIHRVEEIPAMPKARYRIMRDYLPTRGKAALEMMHGTATVQANFDYGDESDMAAKMRMAMGCQPIISALFANSPFAGGRESGFVSRRVEIWRYTDPDRCGILPFVFHPEFRYRDYIEWALDVPMFFVVRDHRYFPASQVTFRQFMRDGFSCGGKNWPATLADWDLHLTTVFPEVRLKRFIEVRGADVGPRDLICALPAFWKGLLYDPGACEAAWGLVASWTLEQRQEAISVAAREALAGRVGGKRFLDWARELLDIAAAGLSSIAERGGGAVDEGSFLDPVRALVDAGRSPGEELLRRWRGEWHGSLDRLIEYARY